jgi:hypothetical protein
MSFMKLLIKRQGLQKMGIKKSMVWRKYGLEEDGLEEVRQEVRSVGSTACRK